MRAERSSPGTIEAPLENAATRKLYLVREDRAEKERQTFLVAFTRQANALMDDLGLPVEFEKQRGKIALKMSVERPLSVEGCEDFDLDALLVEPNVRAERLPVKGKADTYVSTKYVHDKNGKESLTVHPDGHGVYPDKEDLKVARMQNFALGRKWAIHLGSIADALVVMRSYHPKPKEWLWQSMQTLCAASPELEPEQAAKMATMVIKDLVGSYRKHVETV